MKKIYIASLTLLAGASLNAHAVSGTFASGLNSVASSACTLLSTGVNVNISAANLGNYDCNTTSGTIGVAVANTTGKFHVYSLGSNGGSLATDATGAITAAPTLSNTTSAATAAAASS